MLHGQYKFKNINQPLFFYRKHDRSLTTNEKLLFQTRSNIIAKHVNKYKKKINTIALIPIRGSKLDPRSKPMQYLNNKPLINWTVDAALKSEAIHKVIISTPDEVVLNYIDKFYGDKIILHKRDEKLAQINKKLSPGLLESLKFYESSNSKPDALMILNIESPLRDSVYIEKGYKCHAII